MWGAAKITAHRGERRFRSRNSRIYRNHVGRTGLRLTEAVKALQPSHLCTRLQPQNRPPTVAFGHALHASTCATCLVRDQELAAQDSQHPLNVVDMATVTQVEKPPRQPV